jgi:hypothetical protein
MFAVNQTTFNSCKNCYTYRFLSDGKHYLENFVYDYRCVIRNCIKIFAAFSGENCD